MLPGSARRRERRRRSEAHVEHPGAQARCLGEARACDVARRARPVDDGVDAVEREVMAQPVVDESVELVAAMWIFGERAAMQFGQRIAEQRLVVGRVWRGRERADDLDRCEGVQSIAKVLVALSARFLAQLAVVGETAVDRGDGTKRRERLLAARSEEHTSELPS